MLRIHVENNSGAVTVKLEGSVARPSIVKLNRIWIESAGLLDTTKLFIDIRAVTHADAWGVQALRNLQARTGARLITSSPLTKYLADNIVRRCACRSIGKARGRAAR